MDDQMFDYHCQLLLIFISPSSGIDPCSIPPTSCYPPSTKWSKTFRFPQFCPSSANLNTKTFAKVHFKTECEFRLSPVQSWRWTAWTPIFNDLSSCLQHPLRHWFQPWRHLNHYFRWHHHCHCQQTPVLRWCHHDVQTVRLLRQIPQANASRRCRQNVCTLLPNQVRRLLKCIHSRHP